MVTKHILLRAALSDLGKDMRRWTSAEAARPSCDTQKLDPYFNVDPGTMSPYQHGEVFVTDDGAERT